MPKSSYGKGNQKVTPSWVKWGTGKRDGKESTIFGKRGQSDPHGHSVRGRDGPNGGERRGRLVEKARRGTG